MTKTISPEQNGNRARGYPAIALDEAVARAKKLYLEEDKHAVTGDVAASHWGYTATSSSGRTCLATLKKFGLLEEVGGATSGKVRVSKLALDIILLDDDEHRKEWFKALKTAALMPQIHGDLWDSWGPRLPSDGSMRSHLIREMGFNEATASGFIKEFKRTIEFAKLDQDGSNRSAGEEVADEAGSEQSTAGPSPDPAARGWAPFFDGLRMGVAPAAPSPAATTSSVDMREEVCMLDEGQVFLRYPGKLNAQSFEDLKDWLELIVRKAKRSIQEEPKGAV